MDKKRIIVGISGASGMPLALELLRQLLHQQLLRHRLQLRLRPLSLPLHRLRKQKAKLNSLKTMLTFTRRR